MANAYDQFQMLLLEAVSPSTVDLTLEGDDPGWSFMDSFEPIDRAGRDTQQAPGAGAAGWYSEWVIKLSRGGMVQGGTFGGNTMETVGSSDELYIGQGSSASYPDPAKAALPSHARIRMNLARLQGVYTINREQILARLATEPIDDVAGDVIEDTVYQIRRQICNYLYSDGSGMVAYVNDSTPPTIAEGSVTQVAVDGGTPFRFVEGQRYQVATYLAPSSYGSSPFVQITGSGADGASGEIVCVNHDIKNRTVGFESAPGVGNVVLTDNAVILKSGTYNFSAATVTGTTGGSKAAQGFESLLISSGNFPGAFYKTTAMSVTNFPQLAAMVEGDETALVDPTPEVIAELTDLITDSGKMPPSVLIAEQSLWTYWSQLERASSSTVQVPMGSPYTAHGGVSAPNVGHMNHSFARVSSSQIRPGAVYGIAPETWRRFIPLGNKTVRWAMASGGISGTPGIFRAVTSGRTLTELSAAEYDVFIQFGCTDPRRNLRRIGLYSQRTAT